MDHKEITSLLCEYGGDWGINHAQRLIHIVSMLAGDQEYDQEAIWLAAYLHDWGGYEKWMKPGVMHYTRSAEVAKEFLTERNCPQDLMDLVIECIEYHHGGPKDRSIESILFTDADALDLLGAIGVIRTFSMNPRDLRGGLNTTHRYRDMSMAAITLPKTREIAEKRLQETEHILQLFEEEAFGYL